VADLRAFSRGLQVLGFQGGPGDVEPVEIFRAYLQHAGALNDALMRDDGEAAREAVEKRKELDGALDVLCGVSLRESLKANPL
jgi:hypothetical protein